MDRMHGNLVGGGRYFAGSTDSHWFTISVDGTRPVRPYRVDSKRRGSDVWDRVRTFSTFERAHAYAKGL